ncbi:glutathione S-transferase C-terminal domain-containing protein homolog [Anopheles cruzii]|uniref:glutathione S-transferase C-terminal domain-containing protein homolog n=1 Tax=Anopheles cruzii TaxID=68878 RepID=UPI0022EC61BA|nr:glutathione S-transferase C-terminal domain-containing protein homolog [Anopheles cruzii]
MELFLSYYNTPEEMSSSHLCLQVPLDSYIVLALYRYLKIDPTKVAVHFVHCKTPATLLNVVLPSHYFGSPLINDTGVSAAPEKTALHCQLPSIAVQQNDIIISGLCGVCRRLTKEHIASTVPSVPSARLLGFKGNTLVAPADASLWTKFCELDVIHCVEDVLQLASTSEKLPDEIGQLERHLLQPLKSHNIYKLINLVNNVRISSAEEHCQLPGERFDFHANHKFAEGYEKTLADIMLFVCFELIVRRLGRRLLSEKVPQVAGWYARVASDDAGKLEGVCNEIAPSQGNDVLQKVDLVGVQISIPIEFSLYKSDTKKLNLKGDQILTTNQTEVADILQKVNTIPTDIGSVKNARDDRNLFDWDTVPLDARTEGGKLPIVRVLRKQHQLEALANEVIELAVHGNIIVDFCSGTGHLGILLAFLLPRCQIYLLENKEESQQRAMDRVARLGLTNVTFFQCNLDYFTAHFDIGVSLHACGVATDIVLEKCFAQRAHFVSCPCCYGKLYNIEHITYPRSRLFQDSGLQLKEYFCIAHCADQTHDLASERTNVAKAHQGFHCMDIIDRDRALRAEQFGYRVLRTRLGQESCTPKNRLLVGTFLGAE